MRRLWLFLLFAGMAFAEIGNKPDLFFSMLNLQPASGAVTYAKGQLFTETLGGYLYKVRYVGPAGDTETTGRVLAAALGAPKLKDAFIKWFKANREAIAGEKRPVNVRLGDAHVLTLQLKDGKVLVEVAPFEVPLAAFGAPRHVLGRSGPLIREYSDFYCPFCQRLALTVLPKIKTRLVKTGVARFEYRHFPLVEIHPDAIEAARASECAAEQKKFWPFHDRLFSDLSQKKGANYLKIAKELGLDQQRFSDCLASDRYRDVVMGMREEAERLGLQGTPTVFVGPFKLPNPFDVEAYARYAAMAAAKKP